MDERLLVTCTRALLEGWCGPVHGLVQMGLPARAVCTGDFDDRGRVYLWTDGGDASVRPDEVSLDLSRAECRDRVARVLASRERDTTAPGWEGDAEGWALVYDGDSTAGDMPPGIDWADDDVQYGEIAGDVYRDDLIAALAPFEVSDVG